MPAIPVHHTAVDTTSSWDGPAEETKLETPITASKAKAYGWYDPAAPDDDGDGWPDAKNAYKFIHHNIVDGQPKEANLNGVNNAKARLSQADIPAADRAAVEKHLQAHQDDAAAEDRLRALVPVRCFDGNARPFEPFWTFRNAEATESREVEIEFYGPISEYSWFGDEISPKLFKDQLYNRGGGGPVTVRLNSPGGDLIAASVIRATMFDYPGRITVKIDGLAASAAVMVALGGDVIQIQASAYMMIHEAMYGLMGFFNIADLKDLIDELKIINTGIIQAYVARTKLEAEKLQKMMADETWMTASEAVAYGFADQVITGSSKAQQVVNFAPTILTHYKHIPPALLTALQTSALPAAPAEADIERQERLARLREHIRQYKETHT